MFENIIFTNLCTYTLIDINGDIMDPDECRSFNRGIFQQGLYSAIVKYTGAIIRLHHDFLNTERDSTVIMKFLMSTEIYMLEEMEDYYFKSALHALSNKLEADIAYL